MPEYEHQVNVQAQPAPEVQMSNFTGGWKNATEAFGKLDETVKQFETLRNEREATKASNDHAIELSQIETEADNDPNPDNAPMYRQKIDEASARHLESISAPLVRQRAAEAFRLKGYTTYSTISNKFNKQNIEVAQNEFIKGVDLNKNTYLNTVDPVKKRQMMDDTIMSIDNQIKAGIFTAHEGKTIRDGINKNWSVSEAKTDAESNPELARKQFDAGYYAGLDTPEERNQFDTYLTNQEKKFKAKAEVQKSKFQIDNQISLAVESSKGGRDIGSDEISQMIDNEEISADYGHAWLAYKENPSISELRIGKNSGFAVHVENILKGKSKQDVSDAMKKVFEAKDTTKEELQIIAGLAQERGNALLGITVDQGTAPGSKQGIVDSNLLSALDWVKTIPQADASALAKDYITALKEMKPEDAAKQAKQRQILNIFPETAGYGEVPTMIYSQDESLYTIFDSSSVVAPSKIYDPKSKSMVNNTNREITNK